MEKLAVVEQIERRRGPVRIAALEALYAISAGGLYVSGASDQVSRLMTRPILARRNRQQSARSCRVVLLHGLAHNQSWSVKIQRELAARGFVSRAINYRTFGRSIEECADIVAEQILDVAGRSERHPVHVAGHSIGGLVLRSALIRHEELRDYVATGITIGTPHHGTPWALTGARLVPKVGRLIEELKPGSDTLARLDEQTVAGPTRWLSIWSRTDEIVPGRYGCLDHRALVARNIELRGLGHYGLTYNDRAVQTIVDSLTGADTAFADATNGRTATAWPA